MFTQLKKTGNKKQVSFAEDVKTEDGGSLVKVEKPPRFSLIRKRCLEYANQNQYEELKNYIKSFQKKGGNFEEFFATEGRFILLSAMSQANMSFLNFIDENIQLPYIQDVLNNNHHILISFLRAQYGFESLHWMTSERLKNRMEKFELLLKWGAENLLKKYLFESSTLESKKVLTDFEKALKKYHDDTLSSTSEESLTL